MAEDSIICLHEGGTTVEGPEVIASFEPLTQKFAQVWPIWTPSQPVLLRTFDDFIARHHLLQKTRLRMK